LQGDIFGGDFAKHAPGRISHGRQARFGAVFLFVKILLFPRQRILADKRPITNAADEIVHQIVAITQIAQLNRELIEVGKALGQLLDLLFQLER